jgi:molybdenum cofactor biosynthesis enzyme MoaA
LGSTLSITLRFLHKKHAYDILESMTSPKKFIRCIIPFTTLQIGPRGMIYLCCPAWTTYGPVGQINETTTIEDVWNNEKSRYVRKKIYENSLESICNSKYCPYYINGQSQTLETNDRIYQKLFSEIRARRVSLETMPRTIIIAHSGRCNLRCIMCGSNEDFVREDQKLNELIYQRDLPNLLPKLSEIILTGNGDPLFMKDSREFMQKLDSKKYKHISISLITNGQLFNEYMWRSISHNHFGWINVSVDAATPETYEKIRRGGSWKIQQDNLKLISRLRKEKVFHEFKLSFVVMKSNYQEMKRFVEMGLRLGADQVVFQKIFGVADIGENINLTHNKEIFIKIAQVISDPIFKNPIVDLSLISEYQKYYNSKSNKYDRTITQILEKMAVFTEMYKATGHRKYRQSLVWAKAKLPYARKILGW